MTNEKTVKDETRNDLTQAKKDWLEEKLVVGGKVKIGKLYSEQCGCGFSEGEVIELVEKAAGNEKESDDGNGTNQ